MSLKYRNGPTVPKSKLKTTTTNKQREQQTKQDSEEEQKPRTGLGAGIWSFTVPRGDARLDQD
eukprot:1696670-Rhodomonas_salina.1